jgi:hypothetical protein
MNIIDGLLAVSIQKSVANVGHILMLGFHNTDQEYNELVGNLFDHQPSSQLGLGESRIMRKLYES